MGEEQLEKLVARLSAQSKIQNLMGTYSFLLTAGRYHDITELFAKKAPDVRAEMNWGVYEGYDSIVRLYSKYHAEVIVGPGVMAVHSLTTPVIEVAGDCKTAKAVWVSPGHITGGPFTPDNSVKAHWAWMRYGCDFILEDGEWKIWHLHVFGMFMCPFEKSWADLGDIHQAPELAEEYKPDRPPTYSWSYNKNAVAELVPAPPKPYETFDPKTAF
ncbi:MAG: nuclear transport factor 2 family protein [Firmicutes bacterium]|nr:nuclear transport factor 2 family protein [Bacillota bacterium]